MKKFVSLLLALMFVLTCFTACASKQPPAQDTAHDTAQDTAKDDSIAFVASILTGYEKKKALLEQFMEKGVLAQTHRKRNTEPER